MKLKLFGIVCVLGTVLNVGGLQAAESATTAPQAGTSVQTENAARPEILDHLYFNYFGIFHGASINHLDSPYTVDRNGSPTHSPLSTVNFDSEITASYLVTPDIGVGPDIPFLVTPALGQGFTLGDLGIKAFNRKTIATRQFTLYTNLILQGPTSGYSQSRDLTIGVKSTPAVRYVFPNSRFAVGSWSEIKDYVGVNKGKMFKLYVQPYTSYQLTPRLSLFLGYESEWDHNVGDKGMASFSPYSSDVMPGFIWLVSSQVIVNPYLQFYTTGRIGFDTAAVGAVVSATAW